jgi:hypothetical protein
MAGLVAAIHAQNIYCTKNTWMPGTSPGMTASAIVLVQRLVEQRLELREMF